MSLALVTGAAGLVGSEAVRHFANLGFDVVGVDNDLRAQFFGPEASTVRVRGALIADYPTRYRHCDIDIRDESAIDQLFSRLGIALSLVVHAAAQPSHEWATRDPKVDFSVNANGTLNILEACRRHCPNAVFIFMSTNKVYGDAPNNLPLVENSTRFEIEPHHRYVDGIDESMSIDMSMHSLFGASKLAADVLVQEYGRYFGMPTVCFRGGCLSGPHHAGVALHGFLAYLMKCTCTGIPYTVYGYRGKQVRDNIHSSDLISAFHAYFQNPRIGEVYNIGGSRASHCSVLEAIRLCEQISGLELAWTYVEQHRRGDHIWYVSDTAKFQTHYPSWQQHFDQRALLTDIYVRNVERWSDRRMWKN